MNIDHFGRNSGNYLASSHTSSVRIRSAMKADEVDIFALARTNDAEAVERLLSEESNDVNETNDTGVTGLHICATLDCVNTLIVYLRYGADLNIRDYESGWTALHRSVYHGNVRASVLLLRAGASIDTDEGKACVRDKDGLTPAQLLSSMLQQSLYLTKQKLLSSTAMSFGKSDFTLGVPLPKASEVVRPRRIESLLSECIAQLCASKHHSMAVTSTGACYSWGNGRSGRLGHGDEISQPEPRRIRAFGGAGKPRVKQIASGEHHTIVVSDNGDVFTWGSDRFGQLGHGVRFTSNALHGAAVNNAACLEPRRVEALRREYVLHVAAGDAHSLCITRDGEVYAWGSNKDGQLGLKQTELSALPGGSLGSAIPKRVAIESGGYAKGSSGRKLLGLAAAHNNSLLLCRSYTFLSGTDVYQWGHGKFTPSRVIFDGRRGRAASMDKSDMAGRSGKQSSELDFVPVSARKAVSIEQVAAGRDHFAALDLDGRVYAWEADAEQQGLFTAPSVVEALLPECGGARVSAIAAAVNRTCAVTASGELYCWEGVASQVGLVACLNLSFCHYNMLADDVRCI
jgi:alpha-tubulin suppressor-like RCC1 family protein